MEAHSNVDIINERGRIIHNDLVDINGQIDIDNDIAPASENIPTPADNM